MRSRPDRAERLSHWHNRRHGVMIGRGHHCQPSLWIVHFLGSYSNQVPGHCWPFQRTQDFVPSRCVPRLQVTDPSFPSGKVKRRSHNIPATTLRLQHLAVVVDGEVFLLAGSFAGIITRTERYQEHTQKLHACFTHARLQT